jgi:uncharacterized membrane protein
MTIAFEGGILLLVLFFWDYLWINLIHSESAHAPLTTIQRATRSGGSSGDGSSCGGSFAGGSCASGSGLGGSLLG